MLGMAVVLSKSTNRVPRGPSCRVVSRLAVEAQGEYCVSSLRHSGLQARRLDNVQLNNIDAFGGYAIAV